MDESYTFDTKLERFEQSPLWGLHFVVPASIVGKLIEGKDRRMLCTINSTKTIHCAFMPNKSDAFVMLNKKVVMELNLKIGEAIAVSVTKDRSKYGMSVSPEFLEVMQQDEIAMQLFKVLTPGKQRTLIHIVNTFKTSEIRIRKSLAIADHLTANNGKIDFKMLNEAFKAYKDI
jgi:Bacteriocin-protection, YdeI or OmpD-Associated